MHLMTSPPSEPPAGHQHCISLPNTPPPPSLLSSAACLSSHPTALLARSVLLSPS